MLKGQRLQELAAEDVGEGSTLAQEVDVQSVGSTSIALNDDNRDLLSRPHSLAASVCEGYEPGFEALECTVCCEEIKRDDLTVSLRGCCHVFHRACLGCWLTTNKSCPNCRSPADLTSVIENAPLNAALLAAHEALHSMPDLASCSENIADAPRSEFSSFTFATERGWPSLVVQSPVEELQVIGNLPLPYALVARHRSTSRSTAAHTSQLQSSQPQSATEDCQRALLVPRSPFSSNATSEAILVGGRLLIDRQTSRRHRSRRARCSHLQRIADEGEDAISIE